MAGSSECLFSLEKYLGVALKNPFSAKGDMIPILSGYFYSVWQKCQSVVFFTIRLSWFCSAFFFCLFSWDFVVVVAVFSMRRMYLLILDSVNSDLHWIPQSPGLLNCLSIRTEFFLSWSLSLNSYQRWAAVNISGTFWAAKRRFVLHIWIHSRNLLLLKLT